MYSLSLEAFTLMLEESLKIGSGCAVSNGQGTDSTAIWTQVRKKKNKEDGSNWGEHTFYKAFTFILY